MFLGLCLCRYGSPPPPKRSVYIVRKTYHDSVSFEVGGGGGGGERVVSCSLVALASPSFVKFYRDAYLFSLLDFEVRDSPRRDATRLAAPARKQSDTSATVYTRIIEK